MIGTPSLVIKGLRTTTDVVIEVEDDGMALDTGGQECDITAKTVSKGGTGGNV